jgi:hypothetical protein
MSDTRKATPAETLKRRIADPCIPKSEAEWWAHREIARQREESEKLRAEIERLRTGLHRISLASQHSMSSREECGRIARETLEGKP